MGNSSSAYVSGIDRKTLLERTSDTPYILNRIMEELLKKHKIQDYTYLSSPGECKKYVVGLSATLDSIFHHIDIVPQMGRDGVLYFRPIKDVVEQQSEKDKATRQSLCVILSYFYTRIFQIFGALALTLIDDATAMSTSGIYDAVRGLRSGPPGMGPYYGGDDTTSIGGAYIRDIGPFEFLSEDLEQYSSDEYKFRRSPIAMKIKILKSSDWSSSSKKAELNVSLGSKSGKDYYFIVSISANYTSSSSGKSTIRFHIGSSIKVTSRTGTFSTTYTLPSDIKRDLIIDRIRDRDGVKYVVEGEDFSAINAFYDMIRGIVNYISEKGLVGDSYTYIPTTGTRTYDSTGTLAPLRIDRTLQNLQKDKPLAHCIARAIQLLDTRPIEGGRALSYVCKSKFMESRSAG
jgi:hypothetical protein